MTFLKVWRAYILQNCSKARGWDLPLELFLFFCHGGKTREALLFKQSLVHWVVGVITVVYTWAAPTLTCHMELQFADSTVKAHLSVVEWLLSNHIHLGLNTMV